MKTVRELCLMSERAKAFTPETWQEIDRMLSEDHISEMPWYLKFVVAFGAWLASLFFLGFVVALIGFAAHDRTVIGVIGCVVLAVAVGVGRQKLGLFVEQCALAASLSAQLMIYAGFLPEHNMIGTAALLATTLAAALYFIYPDFLSRIITCFGALQVVLFWMFQPDWVSGAGNGISYLLSLQLSLGYWGLQLVVLGIWCVHGRYSKTLSPLAYAVVFSLSAWTIERLCQVFSRPVIHENGMEVMQAIWPMFYIRIGLTAVALFSLIGWASGGLKSVRANMGVFMGLAVALAALVGLKADGIVLAIYFVALGFVLQNRPILSWGILLLPGFLIHYYYSLSLTLMQKSGVLIGSGLVLLALREVLKRWIFTKELEVTQ